MTQRYVKILGNRGYGNGIYQVMCITDSGLEQSYSLRSVTSGDRVEIYKVHCYTDKETIQYHIDTAKKIGLKKKHI